MKIKRIYVTILISLCLCKLGFAEWTITVVSSYTNTYYEKTDGTFSDNLVLRPIIGDHVYPDAQRVEFVDGARGTITNGYAYSTSGIEKHRITGWSASHDGVVSNSVYLVTVYAPDITVTWHWESEYWTETYVATNPSYGSINITNGWYSGNMQLIATPSPPTLDGKYDFDHWEAVSIREGTTNIFTNPTINITVTNAVRYYAYFNYRTNYYLGVTASSNGTVSGADINNFHDIDSLAQAHATPDILFKFSHWSGDIPTLEATNTTAKMLMNQDRNIVANFERIPAPAPTIINPSITNGFEFEWVGYVGREYTIKSSTNLLDWIVLTNVLGEGESISYMDSRELNKAFYKIEVY